MQVIKQNQTLIDMSCQHVGSVAGLMQLAAINGIGITDNTAPGTVLQIPAVLDNRVVKFLKKNEIEIATAEDATELLGGIGYMGIGINFIVS